MTPITDSAGRILATTEQHEPVARPSGPWDDNAHPDDAYAVFAFIWPGFAEDGSDVAMFNVIGGPCDKSTVTADTLRQLGIAVPEGAR